MCRLYGFRANEPTKVECALVLAQNSLMAQSREDHRGSDHSDGWGIAYYEDGLPEVERRATAAYDDLRFSLTAERVFARTVVAHVRKATVGLTSRENTHPYVFGRWSFAHNGTVVGFADLESELASEVPEDLRQHRRGSNDSELAFYWVLGRLRKAGIDLDGDPPETAALAQEFGRAVCELAERSTAAAPDKTARLNFLLTDGRRMIASCWNRDLHLLERRGVHDCEICGIPHIDHVEREAYRACVVSSEPITHEPWQELPHGSLIAVGPDLEARIESLGTPAVA